MNQSDIMNRSRSLCRVVVCLVTVLAGSRAWAGDDNLEITFTTTDAGGEYGSRHVHAVWLTTPSGAWVSTVGNIEVNKQAVWANRRAYSLSSWWGGNPNRSVDVDTRTGATQIAYKTYTINWDWRTLDRDVVPDGQYTLHFECTNADSGNPRNYTTLTIAKARDPWTLGPVTQGGYRDVALTYTVSELGVETLAATDISERSAVINGRITGAGARQRLYTWFYWGHHDGGTDPAAWDYRIDVGWHGNGTFSSTLDHLSKNETYYYRVSAQNAATTLWAPETAQFKAQATVTLFQEGDIWRYFEGRTYPGDAWTTLAFDDQGWLQGPAGLGYADGDDQTPVTMRDEYVTLYLRKRFEIEQPNEVSELTFTVDYDDGFVAYINGAEVIRRGIEQGQTHTSTAGSHNASVDGGAVETIELTLETLPLEAGDNVFAIEVHNQAIDSSDLTMIPTLVATGGVSSPQPDIAVDADLLDFGVVGAGQSKGLMVAITNQGDLPLNIEALTIVGLHAHSFVLASPEFLPVTLAPAETVNATVQFHPTDARSAVYTELLIASDDWDHPVWSVPLQGQGQ
jgi:hypothetical protein